MPKQTEPTETDDVTTLIPECPDNIKPFLTQTFSDIDSAFKFYEDYARICGFTIRRSSEKTNKANEITSKYFVCSRSGKIDAIDSGSAVHRTKRTVSIKSNCLAKLVVGYAGNDTYTVKKFIESHNHEFASGEGLQFLKCNRSMTEIHKHFVSNAAKANIGPTRAHSIFKSIVGSYENVGATAIDFKNYRRDIKQFIGKHDADMIIRKFKDIQEGSDGNFRFEYEIDAEKHLTRLLWADGLGRRSYEVFGDVVSFDATYRTNK